MAEGAHRHFEVRLGVNDYDHTQSPLLWLYPFSEHGTIAGRVIWPDGSLVYEVGISANRIDAPSPYRAATSYAVGDINPDDGWQENFVLDDIPAGYYEIVVTQGKKKHKVEAWVYEYGTTFVEIVIDASTEPTPQP